MDTETGMFDTADFTWDPAGFDSEVDVIVLSNGTIWTKESGWVTKAQRRRDTKRFIREEIWRRRHGKRRGD